MLRRGEAWLWYNVVNIQHRKMVVVFRLHRPARPSMFCGRTSSILPRLSLGNPSVIPRLAGITQTVLPSVIHRSPKVSKSENLQIYPSIFIKKKNFHRKGGGGRKWDRDMGREKERHRWGWRGKRVWVKSKNRGITGGVPGVDRGKIEGESEKWKGIVDNEPATVAKRQCGYGIIAPANIWSRTCDIWPQDESGTEAEAQAEPSVKCGAWLRFSGI
jgi:hypothetical protein